MMGEWLKIFAARFEAFPLAMESVLGFWIEVFTDFRCE